MKCKKCGKRVRNSEKFCTYCGNYMGEVENNTWEIGADLLEEERINTSDEDERDLLGEEQFQKVELSEEDSNRINPPIVEFRRDDDHEISKEEEALLKDSKINDKELEMDNNISVRDSSGTGKTEYYYEHEDLLEAFIGEDYKIIKKMPFNVWSFLLNWMYLLYRKLYITGIVGLIISWLVIVFLRPYILYYVIFTMIVLGFAFNKYYIYIAKGKVEKIISSEEDNDKFVQQNLCKEKGGVNAPMALLIYFVFLVIVFFSLVTVTINKSHNTKFWQENSENKASCRTIIKTAYKNVESEGKVGMVTDATCRVIKDQGKEYEVYIKTEKNGKKYYSYYTTENGYVKYQNNTLQLSDLQVKSTNGLLNEEDRKLLTELKSIEINYQDIYNKSKSEDELILKKKNTEEKLNYIFTQEEVIQ